MVRIDAIGKPNIKIDDSDTCLQSELFLSIGCRIMLLNNTWTSGGLVYGLLGTVRAILYNKSTPPQQPYVILLEFDDFNGPYIQSNLFPMKPIIRSWEKLGQIIMHLLFTEHKV